jgi:hypothetical protein
MNSVTCRETAESLEPPPEPEITQLCESTLAEMRESGWI